MDDGNNISVESAAPATVPAAVPAAMAAERERTIIRTSVIGIIANVLLAAFKAVIGVLSNSIAVVLDAVNNLSDALSSIVTIVGTKIANRKPDAKHPLGHGRAEYLAALIVAAIVLYAGITAFVESVKKIIAPEVPDYSLTALIIIAAAIVVKLVLGRYVSGVGKRVHSGSLEASGKDALFDAVISAGVLASALIFIATGISLEPYVGAIIAIVIVKAGIDMIRETVDDILGKRADRDLVAGIKRTLCEDPDVRGAYDLMLHSYGPEHMLGSVHVEVADTMTADEIDLMERRLALAVYERHGVLLEGIGIYSANTTDNEARELRSNVTRIVASHEGVLQTHGFYANLQEKTINLDIILDFALPDRDATFTAIRADLQKAETVIRALCEKLPEMYPDLFPVPPRYMGVEELNDSSVDLRVVADVEEENIYNARRALNRELKLALDAAGIEIPFPQVVVWQGK